jgi:hypothetical protein
MDATPDLETVVRDQLERWKLTDSPEGVAALGLARLIGEQTPYSQTASPLYGQLRAYLSDLRKLAPEEAAADGVADLQGEFEGLRVVGE